MCALFHMDGVPLSEGDAFADVEATEFLACFGVPWESDNKAAILLLVDQAVMHAVQPHSGLDHRANDRL